MKRLAGWMLFAGVIVMLGSLLPAEIEARSCYTVWAEADRMGSHYRHIVYAENDCEYWLQCSVWTDTDPQPPKMMTVGPGMTEHAETTGSSQYDDPRAFGACHRK